MSEIKFRRDTAFRKQMFIPESFQHPAKMDAQLLLWIAERYSQPGETILDCMAGSGTLMLACTLGRNVVLVELEEKYIKICRDNWEKVRQRPQLGREMGTCQIIQRDARNLEGLLVDKVVMSPPYAEVNTNIINKEKFVEKAYELKKQGKLKSNMGGDFRQTLKKEFGKHTENQDNIGNFPYGSIDKIITSPPYANRLSDAEVQDGDPQRMSYRQSLSKIDAIVISPPYEGIVNPLGEGPGAAGNLKQRESILSGNPNEHAAQSIHKGYSNSSNNIGNLKSTSYLEAMELVYCQCFKILKPSGLMILVTKNFLRDQKEVRLDSDTIAIAERAGFKFLERHYRILPSQSFWRIIYRKRYPLAPVLDKEDILVFEKTIGVKEDV